MKMQEKVPISELTTMRLGGAAEYVATVTSVEELEEALKFAKERGLPVWVMGSGANTIGRDEGFPGVVILMRNRGVEILSEDEELVLRGAAGETWDDVVALTTEKGYSGIEAMSKIPGTLGAAPVQNIGAYGQEIGRVLVEVEAYDLREGRVVTIPRAEMSMGYRHTRFNYGADAGRFVILSVTMKLRRGQLVPPFYNSLQAYIMEHGETDYSPANVRKMVTEIRAAKLPDPAEVPSAGSFFKNVFVDQVGADEAEDAGIPVWRTNDDSGKINAGWLIEAAGLKGQLLHGMRVSEKAALVLINESAKSYADLAAARAEIVEKVEGQFGFRLEQEPVEMVAGGGAEAVDGAVAAGAEEGRATDVEASEVKPEKGRAA